MGTARFGTVRFRTTAAAVLVVAVALVIAAVALVVSLRSVLTRGVAASATLDAGRVARLVESGADPVSLVDNVGDDSFVQVLRADGAVVSASRLPPVTSVRPGDTARITVPFDDDRYLVVAVGTGDGTTVVAGRSLDGVVESTGAVAGWLAVGVPLLLFLLAGLTWRVVGNALAPVEAIRREVEVISAAELYRRVPDPPGADEIARLAATMNHMLDRLERAQSRQRRLVADASHELRSPIAALRQHAEVAITHPGQFTVGGLADTVHGESLRLQRLVDDLLTLARVDEHTLRLRRQLVDVDDLVYAAGRRLRDTTALRVDVSAVSAGRIDGDEPALRRVVDNLADNAARYAGGWIAFAVAERDGFVWLDVDDDGPGIPVEDRERVFDRFVRLDDARTRAGDGGEAGWARGGAGGDSGDGGGGGGAGLGLAIVAELVAAHGGHVAVADSPLGGARLRVRLPAAVQPGFSTGQAGSPP